jgi:hypothetical protein
VYYAKQAFTDPNVYPVVNDLNWKCVGEFAQRLGEMIERLEGMVHKYQMRVPNMDSILGAPRFSKTLSPLMLARDDLEEVLGKNWELTMKAADVIADQLPREVEFEVIPAFLDLEPQIETVRGLVSQSNGDTALGAFIEKALAGRYGDLEPEQVNVWREKLKYSYLLNAAFTYVLGQQGAVHLCLESHFDWWHMTNLSMLGNIRLPMIKVHDRLRLWRGW